MGLVTTTDINWRYGSQHTDVVGKRTIQEVGSGARFDFLVIVRQGKLMRSKVWCSERNRAQSASTLRTEGGYQRRKRRTCRPVQVRESKSTTVEISPLRSLTTGQKEWPGFVNHDSMRFLRDLMLPNPDKKSA